jgi:tetratricopeptide (TPR) repeat protein
MAKPNKTATIGTSNNPLPMFPWMQMSLYLLLILACATLVYLNCLGNAFVMDDMTLIRSNLSIRQFDNIWHILLHSYRPLRTLSYAIDYHFWGLNPIGYHISNIVLHALCSVWVYVILRRLIPGVRVPLYTAILFAVHPIHTDAVTYMSGRRDVLFTFFYLAAFYFFLRYRENSKLTYAVVSFGAFILSLLSKEMAASFPFLIFGYDFIFRFRSSYRAFTPGYFADILGCVRRVIKKYIYFYTLLLFPMLFAVCYYIFLKHSSSMVGWGKIEWWGGSIYTNFLTVAYVLVHYVKKSFFPIDLVADNYSFPIMHSMLDGRVIFSVFVLGSLLCLFLIWMNKKKFIAFSIAFFFITLLPVMQIIPHHDLISEHYLYLPSIGFCFIMGLAFVKLEEAFRKIPLVIFLLFVFTTSIYSIRTLVRNRDWRSEFSIYLSDLSVHPDNKRVHFFLGKAYMDSFLYEKAIQEFDKATSGDQVFTEGYAYKSFIDYNRGDYKAALAEATKVPDNQSWFFNYLNMGKIYRRLGENNIALDCFKKVAFGRYRLPALVNSFEIYQQTWDQEGADHAADAIIRVSEKYLKQIPGDSTTLRNLALCYEWKLKFAEAVQTYKRLEKSEPHLAGDIHLRIEQIRKELEDYQQANELLHNHKNDTIGLLRLARVYYHIKRYPDACRCISAFVHTNPDEAEAYDLLARLYEKKGELDKAIGHATKAVTLQGDNPDYHYLLGVLYAESMEFDRSLESFSKASALGMDNNTFEKDFDKARKDKELYQSGMGNASRALELVRVYLDYNDLASAASILARVQQTAGSDVAMLHQIGALYEEMGDRYKGNAIKIYKHILELSSADARANTRLGYIYWKKVYELPLAVRYFSRSLALDPKQAQASEMKKVVDDLKGMYGDLYQ